MRTIAQSGGVSHGCAATWGGMCVCRCNSTCARPVPQNASPPHDRLLGNIMTSLLKNGPPWSRTWLGRLMFALAWVQVMLMSGYKKPVAMRAIHKGIHRAYEASPHTVQATVKCVHSVVHHMPTKWCVVLSKLHMCLKKHAIWEGKRYTSWVLPLDLTIDGINGAWNDGIACIQPLRESICSDHACPCQRQHNVCV